MAITIVAAPPGSGLRGAMSNLLETVGESEIIHVDVEDQVLSNQELWVSNELLKVAQERNMGALVESLPRLRVIKLWQEGLRSALDVLEGSKAPSKVLSMHLNLYSRRRSEFYSSFTPDVLRDSLVSVGAFVLLIDDIFDMYARLSRPGHVFSEEEQVSFYKRQTRKTLPKSAHESLSQEDEERLRIESRVLSLKQLLMWRRADIVAAETAATQLGTSLHILGSKHPASHLAALVNNEERQKIRSCYVSHPISRPRRRANEAYVQEPDKNPRWDPVVEECNSLPATLSSLHVLAIMPTAIDEYRFSPPRGPDMYARSPRLMPRWPLPQPRGNLLYEPSPGWREEHADLIAGGFNRDDCPKVGAVIRSLESFIWAEIPFRDHLLVAHTESFLVLRPLYHDGAMSEGVEDEIRHWEDAVLTGQGDRRAVFVHTEEDLRVLFNNLSRASSETTAELRSQGITYLTQERDLNYEQANTVMLGQLIEQRLLDRTRGATSLERVSHLRNEALGYAGRRLLWRKLSNLRKAENELPQACIFVLSDDEYFRTTTLRPIARFLAGDTSQADRLDHGQQLSRRLNGGSFHAWASGLLERTGP